MEQDILSKNVVFGPSIGNGAFGNVFRGTCNGTQVAIKVLKQDIEEDLLKEIKMMQYSPQHPHSHHRASTHPNVCQVLGTTKHNDHTCLIMELMEGSLLNLIARNMQNGVCTIPLYKRLNFAIQATKGLMWLHMKNPPIIHRDIKPDNIMYDKHMNIKLTDFGLAQMREREAEVDLDKALGSPLYMAPELLKWSPFTEKIDIYALAITIWVIVSCCQPPTYRDASELIRRVADEGARPSFTFNDPLLATHPRTKAMLCEVLSKMWAQNPHERPSADVCRNGLTEVLFSLIDDEGLRNVWRAAYQKEVAIFDDPIAVSYSVLQECLLSALGINASGISTQQLDCLKAAICTDPITEKPTVTFAEFMCFAQYFGPCDENIIPRIVKLLSSQWFHGPISDEEAMVRLSNKPGSFLVRFSSRRDGDVTVQNTTAKYQVRKVPNGWEISGRVYPSLDELLSANRSAIGTESPVSQYVSIFDKKKEFYKVLGQ